MAQVAPLREYPVVVVVRAAFQFSILCSFRRIPPFLLEILHNFS